MNESLYNNMRETAFKYFEQQVESNDQFHSKDHCKGGVFPLAKFLKYKTL